MEKSNNVFQIYNKKSINQQGGIPLLFDKEKNTITFDNNDTNTLVYGTTRSGKTRCVVMPTIEMLTCAGESMIINDCKGELYHRFSGELTKRGYKIITLNFRQSMYGNAYNCLHIPYKFYTEGNIDKASEFANSVASDLILSQQSNDDPFWTNSACSLMTGLIMLLFRYCKDYNKSEESVNIANIIQLRRTLFSDKYYAKDSEIWEYASEDDMIAANLSGVIYGPKDTVNSILSVFDSCVNAFTIQPTLLKMMSNNDFDIASIGKEKTAVFIIAPDEIKNYDKLVSLFISQCYTYLAYTAIQNTDNKLEKRVNFILDDFTSSLCKIQNMPSMISTACSRNMRFLLIVHSQSSLKQNYKSDADTIVSNCENWIFFGSKEIGLLNELSEFCKNPKNETESITAYDLQHLDKEKHEALVLSGRSKPMISEMPDIDELDLKMYKSLDFKEHDYPEIEKLKFEMSEDNFESSKELPVDKPSIDELIKRIDKEIERLEAEEVANSENQESDD